MLNYQGLTSLFWLTLLFFIEMSEDMLKAEILSTTSEELGVLLNQLAEKTQLHEFPILKLESYLEKCRKKITYDSDASHNVGMNLLDEKQEKTFECVYTLHENKSFSMVHSLVSLEDKKSTSELIRLIKLEKVAQKKREKVPGFFDKFKSLLKKETPRTKVEKKKVVENKESEIDMSQGNPFEVNDMKDVKSVQNQHNELDQGLDEFFDNETSSTTNEPKVQNEESIISEVSEEEPSDIDDALFFPGDVQELIPEQTMTEEIHDEKIMEDTSPMIEDDIPAEEFEQHIEEHELDSVSQVIQAVDILYDIVQGGSSEVTEHLSYLIQDEEDVLDDDLVAFKEKQAIELKNFQHQQEKELQAFKISTNKQDLKSKIEHVQHFLQQVEIGE